MVPWSLSFLVSLLLGIFFVFAVAPLAHATVETIEVYSDSEENEADGDTYTSSSDLELDFDPDWDQLVAIEFDEIPLIIKPCFDFGH